VRTSQAVFYALSFFWLDGFAVPAPAQVTQSVRRLTKQGGDYESIKDHNSMHNFFVYIYVLLNFQTQFDH